MNKDNENTIVNAEDLAFLQEELRKQQSVVSLHDLATKLAYRKNASQLDEEVKVYDPNCKYQVGDLIYKEYDEPLQVSSKGMDHFKGGVVLKVINKIAYDSFNCEMLEVDYTGAGIFRKHVDFMKKNKTQVLLPSASDGSCEAPEVLKKDQDPRLKELPMTERDLRKLEKNLSSSLIRSKDFFHWHDSYQLAKKQVSVEDSVFQKIEDRIRETRKSLTVSDMVTEWLGADSAQEDFVLHCISLNYILDKKHKKKFLYVSPEGGGKWFLKDIFESFLKDLPLAKPLVKLPPAAVGSSPSPAKPAKFPLKIYLTWREVLSGGMTAPKGAMRELSSAREYRFVDGESGQEYTTYFYHNRGIFLGLGEFYQKNAVTQGASLTLEKGEDQTITFGLKRSKKSLSVPFLAYDPKKDRFSVDKKEFLTTSLPNKIIFLENDTLEKLKTLYAERSNLDLQQLLILMFKNFGLEGEALSLHVQRAFHLVDILRHTTLDDVEKTLLSSNEFIRSEKKKGLFYYKEPIEVEDVTDGEEVQKAAAREAPAAAALGSREQDELPAIGTVGEIETPKVILQEKVPVAPAPRRPEPAVETIPPKKPRPKRPPAAAKPRPKPHVAPAAKPVEPPQEEKPKKKKRKDKPKIETEKAPRRRKGERRIIEERIELEESELEALFAVKAEGVVDDEAIQFGEQPEEPEEEYKPKSAEKPMAGIFGDILKSALSQKQQDQTVIKAGVSKKTKAKKTKKSKKEPEE
jgi:hypothetical protein